MVERGCPTRRRTWVPGVDLSITVVGSLIAGGTVLSSFSTTLGMMAMFSIPCVGAVLAFLAQRTVWPSRRFWT